ncbi:CMGC/CLK protein kinase [Cryptococcus deuterogattii R265]|uniref:CMGC/CLK protein kinase n=1 Tax=Cryptococcus deuterogattii (strain R265) TaxID=294750 RepID=UPI001937574A|nr:CMGC/CLK protein kinase [Cryptococcus deuterogattii R265]
MSTSSHLAHPTHLPAPPTPPQPIPARRAQDTAPPPPLLHPFPCLPGRPSLHRAPAESLAALCPAARSPRLPLPTRTARRPSPPPVLPSRISGRCPALPRSTPPQPPRHHPYSHHAHSDSPHLDQPRPCYDHALLYRESYPSFPPSHQGSPYLPPPTPSAYAYRAPSPFRIPPPLTFRYSHSPPPLDTMPPRKKAETSTASSATASNASAIAGTRARRGANGKGWTTEHTYEPNGQRKEIIVIDDSASPMVQPVRKRTRAQVAAEQAAQQQQLHQAYASTNAGYSDTVSLSNGHGSVASTAGTAAGATTKKRKLDDEQEKKAKAKVASTATSASVQTTGTWQSTQAAPANTTTQYQKAPAQPAQRQGPPPWDDSEGHYIVKPDDVIGGRYKIVRLLGQGTFGKVVEARHIETRRKVAIKVIRAVQKYREASKIEIRVLETLRKHDPRNDNKCIHLDEYFDFRNHPCLVSELYGMSVFDFLKQNGFQPFPDKHIQDFAKSLLKSVSYLHSLKLVHTDLKPENILLCSNEARLAGPRVRNARSKSILKNTEIRLIDFGSATFESEYHSSVVSTRHYRAPEIILGLSWSYPCDMFSIGCILVEFYTGNALFQTHDNLEHLAMMEVVMGKFSQRMIEKGKSKKPEYFKGNKIDFPNSTVSKASRKYVKSMQSLKQVIDPANRHQQLFLDLCTRLLEHDPDVRIKVQDALRHPYLTEPIPEPA